MKKVLCISGSIGLGHATRDLAIANELRRQNPEVEISWIAAEPAGSMLAHAGEKMIPESQEWANETVTAENTAQGSQFRFNVVEYILNARNEWAHNVELFKRVISKEHFDLVVGDETYEIIVALKKEPELKKTPFVMIYDFIGTQAMTRSLKDIVGAYYWNRFWSRDFHKAAPFVDLRLFVGQLEDIPDTRFGFLLPSRRAWAVEKCKFAGYILPFDARDYEDRKKTRAKLGYGNESLVVCSIGGTAIGKEMLELCAQSYTIVKKRIPNLRMILICGPRLAPESLNIPEGIEVKGYVPRLYELFAASDLSVVQPGGTTTIELTALKRPFLYFPLEDHFEQSVFISQRLARHRAGVRMSFSETTPELLADAIAQNLGKEVNYADIPTDGAPRAAELISQLL